MVSISRVISREVATKNIKYWQGQMQSAKEVHSVIFSTFTTEYIDVTSLWNYKFNAQAKWLGHPLVFGWKEE